MRHKLNSLFALLLVAAVAVTLPSAEAAGHRSPQASHAKKKRSHASKRRTRQDRDGDGIPNRRDRDVDGDGVPNRRDRDVDGDRIPNRRDRDIDGDFVRNTRDKDMDGDGLPNDPDPDIDGDDALNFADDDSDSSGSVVSGELPAGVRLPRDFFGVVADEVLGAETGAARGEILGTIARTGARTLRQKFDWAEIERRPGDYDFSLYDGYVADATRNGFRILPVLFNPPPFRSKAPPEGAQRGTYPPKSDAEFADFATALVRRYGPGGAFWKLNPSLPQAPLRAWQVWNEPNTEHYWPTGPTPEQYAAMLRTVGAAIKRADPGAEVVSGGLPQSRIGMPINEFLTRMYKAGARNTFDTLAIHPYARATDGVYDIMARARLVMDRHGDADVKMLVSEAGWATGGPTDQPFNVGEPGQAALIRRVWASLVRERERWKLRGLIYFNWRDQPAYAGTPDFWGLHTGLLTIDGHAKPGFWALSETVGALTAP